MQITCSSVYFFFYFFCKQRTCTSFCVKGKTLCNCLCSFFVTLSGNSVIYKKEIFYSGLFFSRISRSKEEFPNENYNLFFVWILLKQTLSSRQKSIYTVKIPTSEQITFAAVLYFGQVFVFCRLINKSTLEWFLTKLVYTNTLTRSTNSCSRNQPTLCFWLARDNRQMPITEQFVYQTDKSSNRRRSLKNTVCKNSQYSLENAYVKYLLLSFK